MEITFISPDHFGRIYYVTVMVFMILTVYQCHTQQVLRKDVAVLNASFGVYLAVFMILLMGLRPIDWHFGDTINYAKGFYSLQDSGYVYQPFFGREWLWENLFRFCASYADIHVFFLICSTIYIGGLTLALKQIFGIHYYVPFMVFVCMFTFWTYGVNGVRNGVAASVFILALANINRPVVAILLAFCSTGFHKSMWLVVMAGVVAWYIKNSYLYLVGWFLSIILSLSMGMTLQNMISQIGLFQDDSRFQGYLTGSNQAYSLVRTTMTFRWDFVAFSALGIAFGWYFIMKRKFKDEYYNWIFNIYCFANAFWIIVIRASYSNRIAQISWFILPLVMAYPTSKKRFWTDHEKYMGYAVIIMYAFNFYYNIILWTA